jgi:naringenin 3-dioxygenase
MAQAKTITSLSEENTFESGFIRDEDERPKVAYNQFSNEIPVISIAGIDEVNGRREEICKKIVEACEEWGIFQIVDHGVDTKLISEMTHLSREFFALPPEEKLRFDMSGGKKGGFVVSSHLQVIILTIYIILKPKYCGEFLFNASKTIFVARSYKFFNVSYILRTCQHA